MPHCNKAADYRYTWPGRDEAFICQEHSQKLKAVSEAIGCYVQLIQLPAYSADERPTCQQQVSESKKEDGSANG